MRLTTTCRGVALALLICSVASAAAAQSAVTNRYDDAFRKYSKRFFGPGFDWRLFKAQGMVESSLLPQASSGTGARGIMQLLPTTYADAKLRNPELGDIGDATWNIAAGIWYARQLWEYWYYEVNDTFRQHFMLGSYNAGRATVVRAQKMAQAQRLDARKWTEIVKVAPGVARWRYQETLDYVARVFANKNRIDRRGNVRPN